MDEIRQVLGQASRRLWVTDTLRTLTITACIVLTLLLLTLLLLLLCVGLPGCAVR